MNVKYWQIAALAGLGCSIPEIAYANLVWPALMLESRLLSLPVIVFGLLIEIAVLKLCFSMTLDAATKGGIVANTISAAFGVVLIPIAGFAWEFPAGITLYKWFDIGTFNPITWAATFLFAALITTSIEFVVLRRFFSMPGDRRSFLVWLTANCASVVLAFISLLTAPDREGPFFFDLWPFG